MSPAAPPSTPLFPAAAPEVSQGFTGRDLLRQWFKYWGTLSSAVVVVTALTAYGLAVQPPQYVANAKVWIKTDQQGSPSFLSGVAAYREGQMPDPVNRKIETEMQLLLARPNVEAVVRRLGIRSSQLQDTPLSYLSARWSTPKPKTAERELQDTVDLLLKAIKVEPARSKAADTASNLLEVQLETTDQALAPKALNALIEQYQQYGTDLTRQQGQSTYALIDKKMQEAQGELNTLDQRILKLTVAQGSQADLPTTDGNTTLAMDADSGLRMDTVLGTARTGGPSSVGLIKSQAVAQEGRLEELRQLYTDDAEMVRSAKRQLAQTQARLSRTVKAGAELEAQLKQLERARNLAQERVNELRRKLDQIELYLNSAPDESATRVFTERALEPEKPEKKKKLILAIVGPLAGLALGLLLAGLREYFDHRLQSAQDVARYLGLDTLGTVPEHHKARP